MGLFRRVRGVVCAACVLVGALAFSREAQASGAVERMAQVLVDPNNPSHVVVRWGAASEGLLFSNDGGHTFTAICAAGVDPKLGKLSRQAALYDSALAMTAGGQLWFADSGGAWLGAESGCAWTKQPALEGKWNPKFEPDPKNRSELFALVISDSGTGDESEAHSDLMRRSDDGVWSVVGPLHEQVPHQRAFGADLIVSQGPATTRFYASLTSSSGALGGPETTTVVVSDDGGHSFRRQQVLPMEQARIRLLAVDPLEPNRVLAVLRDPNVPDTLLLSDDQGNTFRKYGQVHELSGVVFDPTGSRAELVLRRALPFHLVLRRLQRDAGRPSQSGVWARGSRRRSSQRQRPCADRCRVERCGGRGRRTGSDDDGPDGQSLGFVSRGRRRGSEHDYGPHTDPGARA